MRLFLVIIVGLWFSHPTALVSEPVVLLNPLGWDHRTEAYNQYWDLRETINGKVTLDVQELRFSEQIVLVDENTMFIEEEDGYVFFFSPQFRERDFSLSDNKILIRGSHTVPVFFAGKIKHEFSLNDNKLQIWSDGEDILAPYDGQMTLQTDFLGQEEVQVFVDYPGDLLIWMDGLEVMNLTSSFRLGDNIGITMGQFTIEIIDVIDEGSILPIFVYTESK